MLTGVIRGPSGSDRLEAQLFPVAEATTLPEGNLPLGSWSATARAGSHAMNVGTTGMAGPDAGLAVGMARCCRMVLLDAQVLDGVASRTQRGQKLRTAVLQCLSPLGMTGPDGEDAALKAEGLAVRRQLCAGDAGPVLPESRQTAIAMPVAFQILKTVLEWSRRSRLWRLQQFKTSQSAALRVGSHGHGLTLGRIPLDLANLSPDLDTSMGFFDRLSRLVRANANAAVSGLEDPAKILDQSVADMQSDLVKLRQAVALAIASQKRLRNQAEQAETQSKTWYERAELALKKGEEDLAREALSRRKTFQETATSLNAQIQAQDGQVETLKKSLVALEGKIAQAKTKKDMLKARAEAAKAQQQLQSAVGNLGTNSAMAAFERMEDKVEQMEATGQAAAELAGADLESQFAALESGDDVDDELAALRQQLKGGPEAVALPAAESQPAVQPVKVEQVDADLEELKRSIDKL